LECNNDAFVGWDIKGMDIPLDERGVNDIDI
jgi:hypothetical protein